MSWLLNDLQEALKKYDKLKINKENGTVTGKYEIINPNSNLVLDSFSLIFTFPHNYPNLCLPIVKELERKIPRIADRHVYPDGKLCLTTPINEFLICKKGISFLEFLDDIVGPYLAAQMAISMGWLDGFPQGEYEHGYEGIFQSYSEFFEITDLSIIISGIPTAGNGGVITYQFDAIIQYGQYLIPFDRYSTLTSMVVLDPNVCNLEIEIDSIKKTSTPSASDGFITTSVTGTQNPLTYNFDQK